MQRICRRTGLLMLLAPLALLAVVVPGTASAQESAGVTPTLGSPAAIAGIRHYSPGTWSLVTVDVFNSTDEPIDVLASTFFKQQPHLQFGRQMWVPAHARRTVWYPVRPPAEASRKPGTPLDVETMLYDRTGGQDTLIKSPTGQISRDALLAVGEDDPVTAIMRDGRSDDDAQNLVIAMRTGKHLSRRVVAVEDLFLPTDESALEGLRHLVICSDEIARDAAGLAAVRRWLHNGGQLWLMLDELSEETVTLLLESAYTCQLIDDVELTTVDLRGSGMEFELSSPQPIEFERPVRQVRVLAPDAEIAYRVNGWPAAFFQRVGQGNVLFTTLSPHAWMRARLPSDPRPESPTDDSGYISRTPILRLAERFLVAQSAAKTTPDDRSYVSSRIGYEVARKPVVSAWLGGFCLVLLAAGAGLARAGRLERMAWVTPLAALTASLGLAAVGAQSKNAAAPALSVLQTTHLVPGSEDVQVKGLAALYQQDRADAPWHSRAGAMLLPDMDGLAGGTKRMVWTDIDAWHWENLSIPSGLRLASLNYNTRAPQPAFAGIQFNPQGLSGQFTQSTFENLSDAVIGSTGGRWMSVDIDESGRISADASDVLPPGVFLSGTLLTEEQRRRQDVYARHFPQGVETQGLEGPTLLVWADALDLGIELPPGTTAFGSTLISIPLDLERPESGSRITVPSMFLDIDAVFGPESARGSKSTYNRRTGLWLEAIRPSLTWLRFALPQKLQHVELTGGVLSVKVHAPGRPLRILGLKGEQVITLSERNSVVGSFQLNLESIAELDRDPEGGLLIGLDVGAFAGADPDAPDADVTSLSNTWQVDYVRLDLQAHVPER